MFTFSPGLRCRYEGIVDSVGFGVRPDTTLVGTFTSTGLPDVQRSLNWVHLATRYPGARSHQCARDGAVPPERVCCGRDPWREIAMAAQGKALPAVSKPNAIDEAGEWFWNFLKNELTPYPGRAWVVARVTISATLVMLLVMTFQIPNGFLGVIFTLFLSRENPTATFVAGSADNCGFSVWPPPTR